MENVQLISGWLTPYAFETITVSTTAIAFTAANIEPATVAERDKGVCRLIRAFVETDQVRFRDDGQTSESGPNPTATIGNLVEVGTILWFANLQQMKNTKFIRVTTDAKVRCTYFR